MESVHFFCLQFGMKTLSLGRDSAVACNHIVAADSIWNLDDLCLELFNIFGSSKDLLKTKFNFFRCVSASEPFILVHHYPALRMLNRQLSMPVDLLLCETTLFEMSIFVNR
ncbi:uncharacterized protein LOC110008033 isoform X2 [Amborella trichopoda]|uniref:uncharacterized protein LOC110008033 isoform X2 n=1 Tax=Amborella trichopoda TaxID=13333 RepID=UPI0009BE2828|nr:uncharacterized protein LOC110008033 isoform X2 [Amborella trichopoda]|eukprot:XP_020528613.1 uncharacterized protein LOC110008033 isoform X2 [Amborella trichopoda]